MPVHGRLRTEPIGSRAKYIALRRPNRSSCFTLRGHLGTMNHTLYITFALEIRRFWRAARHSNVGCADGNSCVYKHVTREGRRERGVVCKYFPTSILALERQYFLFFLPAFLSGSVNNGRATPFICNLYHNLIMHVSTIIDVEFIPNLDIYIPESNIHVLYIPTEKSQIVSFFFLIEKKTLVR